MFDVGPTELLMIVIVAIVVIGPKDLPRALYKVGQIVGKARAMSRHFRSGIDAMIREVELEEMEKKWEEDNRRIMAQKLPPAPMDASGVTPALAAPAHEEAPRADGVLPADSGPADSGPADSGPADSTSVESAAVSEQPMPDMAQPSPEKAESGNNA